MTADLIKGHIEIWDGNKMGMIIRYNTLETQELMGVL